MGVAASLAVFVVGSQVLHVGSLESQVLFEGLSQGSHIPMELSFVSDSLSTFLCQFLIVILLLLLFF